MGNIAVRAQKISKAYKIRKKSYRHDTLRDRVAYGLRDFIRQRIQKSSVLPDTEETIWALSDVSFEIRQGELVGIIGYNGAGKSTLLKILSRITAPTTGRVQLYGRVGSLLEVGTGFHPELSGRENIYLSGAILGMKKAEIKRKFDEIVDFSEIEKFIDTPVKRYSSGMYMRLAFAVAAHLEPEILLVDEVLAVGDGRFQKKCFNKMQDVGQQGRTVLFVSHSMPAVTRLCERAILLKAGKIMQDGPSHYVVGAYLTSELATTASREWLDSTRAPRSEMACLRAVRVRATSGQITDTVEVHETVCIEMEYDVLEPGHILMPHFQFYNQEAIHAFSAHDLDPEWRRRPRPAGRYISTTYIPGDLLSEGMMFIGVGLDSIDPSAVQFYERDVVAFQVTERLDAESARGDYSGNMGGVIRPRLKWTTAFVPIP